MTCPRVFPMTTCASDGCSPGQVAFARLRAAAGDSFARTSRIVAVPWYLRRFQAATRPPAAYRAQRARRTSTTTATTASAVRAARRPWPMAARISGTATAAAMALRPARLRGFPAARVSVLAVIVTSLRSGLRGPAGPGG